MVTGLWWHFSNFTWLCKVFLQTFLHFASQFHNLKAISKLGGHFAAILKLGDHFAAKWHFRRPFHSLKVISQPKAIFAAHFAAAKWVYRASKWYACAKKWFRSWETPCEMGLWLRKLGVFTLWHFAAVLQLRNEGHYGAKCHSCAKIWFRNCKTPCEMGLWLRNFLFLIFFSQSKDSIFFFRKQKNIYIWRKKQSKCSVKYISSSCWITWCKLPESHI